MVDKHHALAREEILEALSPYSGVTTADGATPGNDTLIDSNLIGKNDFIAGKTILIGSGVDASHEDKLAATFDPLTGKITVSAGFSAQIKQDTPYRVLNVPSGGVVSVLLNDIKAQTDLLPVDPASESGAIARKYPFLDFWSKESATITITGSAANIDLPDVTIENLPSGLVPRRVCLVIVCRAIMDISHADNYINAANKTIRVKKSTGTWGQDDLVAITFANGGLYTVSDTKENGPTIGGDADIKAEVDGAATYNVGSEQTNRGDALVAKASSLVLYDVQTILRMFYS